MTAARPAVQPAAPGLARNPGVPGSRARPLRTRREETRDAVRAFATAARIGWQTESNWADPLLFVIYSVAKPLASVLILLFMVQVISGGNAQPAFRGFVVVGSALWSFVMGGMAGLAWSLLDDRERYRMLKYLYLSPNSLLLVLLGRGAARLAIAAMGALITLGVGIVFLGLGFDPGRVDWLLLVPAMLLGLTAVVSLGISLAAVCMQTRQESWQYPDAVAGAMFLLVGAVFPLAVLPQVVQFISYLLPLTWWLEGVRQGLLPGSLSAVGGTGSLWTQITGTAQPGTASILLALLATTAVTTLGALAAYRWSEHRAKERGLLDLTTGS